MSRSLLVTLATILLAGLGMAEVRAADGLYLGAGVGVATFRDEVNTETFDSDDVAYRAFVGWRFDVIPLIDLAVEAAYTDFGRPSQTLSGQEASFTLRGPSLAGLLIVPLGPVDFYGKAGMLEWKSDRSVSGTATSRSGTDPFYGVGAGFYLWKIGFRAEYERFQIKDVDRVEMLSVNALFQF